MLWSIPRLTLAPMPSISALSCWILSIISASISSSISSYLSSSIFLFASSTCFGATFFSSYWACPFLKESRAATEDESFYECGCYFSVLSICTRRGTEVSGALTPLFLQSSSLEGFSWPWRATSGKYTDNEYSIL